MPRRAWLYIWSVFLAGVLLSGWALHTPVPFATQWPAFVVLLALATAAQFMEAEAPGRQSYYPHFVFFFAGLLLLHPFLFVLVVAIPHLVEWGQKRLTNSPHLRNWYIQPFNIASHIIAGLSARAVYQALVPDAALMRTPVAVLAVASGALAYALLNHLIVGLVLKLARGISLRESGVLEIENLLADLVLLLLGCVMAGLWATNPWLILPALSPLLLIYRALTVPQLKKEAQTDAKTGLLNVRHWTRLLTEELEKAGRAGRPVALLMADLDLLRNINNTYGHQAGDAVLAGVGQAIREVVADRGIAARFGGEEFAITLPEMGLTEALAVAERLRRAVEATAFVVPTSRTPIRATVTIGVSHFPEDGTTADALIHQADVALYQAKLRGRNRVVCAADVPHFIKLENEPPNMGGEPVEPLQGAARPPVTTPYAAAFVQLTGSAAETPPVVAEAPPSDKAAGPTETPRAAPAYPAGLAGWFIGGIIFIGVGVAAAGLLTATRPDMLALTLLVALAVVAELFQIEVYHYTTVSVSVAVNFAAALSADLPGVAVVSAAIVLVHYFRRRPRWYKTGFNWATHVLAGLAPILVIRTLGLPLTLTNLPLLLVPMAVAALLYYIVDTGMIAAAIGLSSGISPATIWREQFRWLIEHYLVLCLMGLFLAVAYVALGLLGLLVFALPVFMMRYTQKQYVERTEESVRELRRMNEELGRANREVVAASNAIRQLNDELFQTLAKILDARDPYVHGHASKVADYATAIALEMGLPADRVELLRQAAFLHDIGKIGIPEQVLHKIEPLTAEERELVKSHAALGAGFLETSQGLRRLAPFVKYHHEWWNGGGYPEGLTGEQVPLEARILAVSDAVEAMASDRPYHQAMSLDEIVAELQRGAGSQFDPAVVAGFVRVAERNGRELVVNSAREVARRQGTTQ